MKNKSTQSAPTITRTHIFIAAVCFCCCFGVNAQQQSAQTFSAIAPNGKEIWYNVLSQEARTVETTRMLKWDTATVQYKEHIYEGDIVIPETAVNAFNGVTYTVVQMGYNTFWSSKIKSVVLPKTLQNIVHQDGIRTTCTFWHNNTYYISNGPFTGTCGTLRTLEMGNKTPIPIDSDNFCFFVNYEETPSNVTLLTPYDAHSAYYDDPYWGIQTDPCVADPDDIAWDQRDLPMEQWKRRIGVDLDISQHKDSILYVPREGTQGVPLPIDIYTTSLFWEITTSGSWMSFDQTSGHGYNDFKNYSLWDSIGRRRYAATVNISVEPNPGPGERTAVVFAKIASKSVYFFIIQKTTDPDINVYPANISLGSTYGLSQTVNVQVDDDTPWNVTIAAANDWLTFGSPHTGIGPGSFSVAATVNATGSVRQAVLSVTSNYLSPNYGQKKDIIITQSTSNLPYGVSPLSIAFDPVSPFTTYPTISHGVDVVVGSGVKWKIASSASWLSFPGRTPGAVSTGSGSFVVEAAPNTGAARQADVLITNESGATQHTITVLQSAGRNLGLSTQTLSFAENNTAAQTVNVGSNYSWVYAPSDEWISVSSPSGSTTSLSVNVQRNYGNARTGSITITNGHTTGAISVTQASDKTIYLSADSITCYDMGDTAVVRVAASAGVGWTASRNGSYPWMTLIPASPSGTGAGSFKVALAANPGAKREGSVTVASTGAGGSSRSVKIVQIPNQTLSASHDALTFGTKDSTATVTVTTFSDWKLVATDDNAWMRVSPTTPVSGNSTFTVSVTPNRGAERTDSIIIYNETTTLTIPVTQRGNAVVGAIPSSGINITE